MFKFITKHRDVVTKYLTILLKKTGTTVGENVSHESTSTFPIKLEGFKLHRLEKGPEENVVVTKPEGLEFYRQMFTIRRFENEAANLYKAKIIRGFCHLYSGQEACAVGIRSVMKPGDNIITAYRCHGWSYVMGVPVATILCELTGRTGGISRGKGGSMHMYGKDFYGGNGIVGSHVPLGVGIAFCHKYFSRKNVCITCYGDGAANQGQVAEVFNIAKLWNLPVIFVIENNQYGLGTNMKRAAANTEFYKRGDLIPGVLLNGMDVLAVREGTRFAIEHCLAGHGPILVEMLTYRYFGHSMSDPGTSYRTREEVQKVRDTRDPLLLFKNKLLSNKILTESEIKDIENIAKEEVNKAKDISQKDKEISVDELTYDIYSNDTVNKLVRNVLPNVPRNHKRFGKLLIER